MKINKIKPIPKRIIALIKRKDKILYPAQSGHTRFYDYLTKNDGELVKVTVAVKNYYKKWYCKQVVVHGIDSSLCYIKDIVCYVIAGYVVGWHDLGASIRKNWWEDSKWDISEDKNFNMYCPVVNADYIDKFPEFKYSEYKKYPYFDLFHYLKIYREYPQAEYLVKAGLYTLSTKKTVLKKVKKDKTFRKWLMKNLTILKDKYFYVSSIFYAYKNNVSLQYAQSFEEKRKKFNADRSLELLREELKNDLERFFSYMEKQQVRYTFYQDYYQACLHLGLDMSLDKNRYPHDLERWHDIRIDEYASTKALADKKARKKLYSNFTKIIKQYIPLSNFENEDFIIVIAKSPAELIREGEILNHCVGRMGYDQKVIKNKSLIFFVRQKDSPNTPYITFEYSLEKHNIIQSHGKDNRCPNLQVSDFIEKQWLPFANKQIKQIQKAA